MTQDTDSDDTDRRHLSLMMTVMTLRCVYIDDDSENTDCDSDDI